MRKLEAQRRENPHGGGKIATLADLRGNVLVLQCFLLDFTITVGETYDFEFRPEIAGELTLEVVRPPIIFGAQITPSHKAVEARSESRIEAKIMVR